MKPRLLSPRHLVVWVCITWITQHTTEAKRQRRSLGWGDWQAASECSRTCGGGVQYKQRACTTGTDCEGPSKIYLSCNTQPCPSASLDFRLEQCQKYNRVGLNIPGQQEEEWVPYYGDHGNQCALTCLLKGTNRYYTLSPRVVDGTRCNDKSQDVCIDGACQAVGCDGVLGSKSVDACGVCGGNASTCDSLSGVIKTGHLDIDRYNDVLLLPAGSANIRIQENSHSSSYLSLRAQSGDYVLNPAWQIDSSKDVSVGGAVFRYVRDGHQEAVSADGPLTEAVYVVILRQAGHNAAFQYSYSIPHDLSAHRHGGQYSWQTGAWGDCTEQCAGGSRDRSVTCVDGDGVEVSSELCNSLFSPDNTQECNTQPCEARWHQTPWSACSTSCGTGVQTRTVYCRQPHTAGVHAVAPDDRCHGDRPATVQSCNQGVECPGWVTGGWSRCNRICGPGQKTRSVRCEAKHVITGARSHVLPDQRCVAAERPSATEDCNSGPCRGVEWIVSAWSGCHGSCGGSETRRVVCSTEAGVVHDDGMCDPARRPDNQRVCHHGNTACPLPGAEWHASQWSKCSAQCGRGLQRRSVVCAKNSHHQLHKMADSECDPAHKMAATQECNGTQCTGEWLSGPYGKCSVACGGGLRSRQILCFVRGKSTDIRECDRNLRPDDTEDCNLEACDDDNLIVIGGCKNTAFGCCPDGITPAEDAALLSCPSQDRIPVGLCIEAEFGCCFDGVTPAQGPFNYGCPDYTCKDTKYGCCSDGQTPADSSDGAGCPYFYTCDQSAFGCCPDGVHFANGFDAEGCDDYGEGCDTSRFGCCEDGVTAAEGPGGFGCPDADDGSGSLSLCELSLHGCCPDNLTPARGPNNAGCNDITGCQGALYGCCPDGVTTATGPGYAGCGGVYVPEKPSCALSPYGCCPDGITTAEGYHGEGCYSDCFNTIYGCCSDGVTTATGPDNAGCAVNCGMSTHGCCPDGSTEATGPLYEGCPGGETGDCHNTLFGCCDDGRTAATGFDKQGCPQLVGGCAGTRFGCCADGKSYAHGDLKEGCPETSCQGAQYGCCPDGKTVASGPGYAGCPYIPVEGASCDQTAYGCCPDGISVATGLDFVGCYDNTATEDCKGTAHGCCDDGVTIATGPNKAGCTDGVDRGVACGLPNDRGPCSNYSVRWFFDPSHGDCSRFWFGGCEGNPNNFETKDLCKAQCIKPKGIDRCYLPSSVGRCRATEEKFFYNHETGQCETFLYGGCQGNDNRFDSKEECSNACVIPHRVDLCALPSSVGPCRGRFQRWHFDDASQTCQQFVYGGCRGNENRFDTKEACEGRCLAPLTKVCSLPSDSGPCKADFPRWFFDSASSECKQFVYGGCRGNGNRFSSKSDCEFTCREPTKPEKDICTLPPDSGPCEAAIQRWAFDQSDGFCTVFTYGGCGGNDNRFESELDCRQTCDAKAPVDVCSLPLDVGPCQGSQLRFYYDISARVCRQMVYGGCDGNQNNFASVVECQKVCGGGVVPSLAPEIDDSVKRCLLPRDPGPCLQALSRWYYDDRAGSCLAFEYGGCEGNRNRFLTQEHCLEACGVVTVTTRAAATTTTTPVTMATSTTTEAAEGAMCSLPYNPGNCYAYQSKWYYDDSLAKCKQFLYGGCGGNENRFESREDCEMMCTKRDVCSLPQDSGECLAYIPAFYYDSASATCREFTYGGCGGNGNRFKTRELCEYKCTEVTTAEVTGLDVCVLPRAEGPCKAQKSRWSFNHELGRCVTFSYGGCQGNENNFESKEDCQAQCPVTEICVLPKSEGSCQDVVPRYYYSPASRQCELFYYSGCGGNANNYATLAACLDSCGALGGAVTEPAAATTRAAVVATEAPTQIPGTVNVCSLRKDPGPCKGYNPVWYYEFNTRTCRRFLYGGCDGNENRFETREACAQRCLYQSTAQPAVTTTTTTTAPSRRSTEVYVATAIPEVTEVDDETTNYGSGSEVTTDSGESDICLLEKSMGEYCTGWELKWHFDPETAACRQFYYGGCSGNANRFTSEDDCHKMCVERKTQTSDRCYLPPNKGPCFAMKQRWYYDNIEGTCKDFMYGGCQGNTNRFKTKELCQQSCQFRQRELDVCFQPKEVGPCKAYQLRYYFDQSVGMCLSYQFGGCQGNENNFNEEKDCYMTCSEHMVEEPKEKSTSDCYQAQDPGPCFAEFVRFFYDADSGMCRPFIYGGCQGNGNNFETQIECYGMCEEGGKTKETAIYAPGDCYDPPNEGSADCVANIPRWYFDHNHGDCRPFYYGCDGNGNNFLSYDDCSAYCSQVTETCGVLQCNLDCPFGYARHEDGCPKCECRDPCLTQSCPSDQECRVEEVVCVLAPCKPLVVCRPKPKAGECPVLEPSQDPTQCGVECSEDVECPDDAKCCSTGCGMACVVPYTPVSKPGFCPPLTFDLDLDGHLCNVTCVNDEGCPGETDKCCHHNCGSLCVPALPSPPECRKSVFGCCPDGETMATGWNNIGCPEEAPVIENVGQLDIVAVQGENVTIKCIAKGAPTPQVRWYKSRFPISYEEEVHMSQLGDGSLQISGVRPEDSTSYTCRAYNNVGSATKTYTLLVQVPVQLIEISEALIVTPGEDMMLNCVAVGNPTPEIRWFHELTMIDTASSRYFVDTDGTLIVSRVVVSDEGQYTCEANNGVGEPVTAVTNVNVLGPYSVEIAAHGTLYDLGSPVRLECTVSGDTMDVAVHWLKDGFPVLDDDDSLATVTANGALVIESVTMDDEGRYTCSAQRLDTEVSTSTNVKVKGVKIPTSCIDKPWYANCDLIIEAKMCRHAYFSIFCCRSCHEAGLLP